MRKRLAIALTAACGLALIGWSAGRATGQTEARLVSETRWQVAKPWFGGFSAIEVDADGQGFVALSDRGHFVRGRLLREAGDISGVRVLAEAPLLDRKGQVPRRYQRDSEGLAQGKSGPLYVSFEGVHRVDAYDRIDGAARPVAAFPKTPKPRGNGSLEALAIDNSGQVLAILEEPLGAEDVAVVYGLRGSRWQPAYEIARSERFHPVGADIGPDGRFYLLERGFNGIGFRSRVRRFDMTPTGMNGETVLMQTGIGTHDNLEGLSVWRDPKGHIRLTMISDDNFRFFQRTEIVEYVVSDNP